MASAGRMKWKVAAIGINTEFKAKYDTLRTTLYTVRLPLVVCNDFLNSELELNKKFNACKAEEKNNKYSQTLARLSEVMTKRGIKFLPPLSFEQIKKGTLGAKAKGIVGKTFGFMGSGLSYAGSLAAKGFKAVVGK